MIFDQLKNSRLYFHLGDSFEKAFKYLSETDFTNMEPGKYEIDGDNVYALVQTYNTKPMSSGKWEAHKQFADIQYIVSGQEKMGFTSFDKVIPIDGYNADKDYAIYKGEGNFLIADEGNLAVFFPTDVHMPSLALHIPKEVKKVVVKVRVAATEVKPVDEAITVIEDEIKPLENETPENPPVE
jgi:YhcH/YjgK/YiaL family protein